MAPARRNLGQGRERESARRQLRVRQDQVGSRLDPSIEVQDVDVDLARPVHEGRLPADGPFHSLHGLEKFSG